MSKKGVGGFLGSILKGGKQNTSKDDIEQQDRKVPEKKGFGNKRKPEPSPQHTEGKPKFGQKKINPVTDNGNESNRKPKPPSQEEPVRRQAHDMPPRTQKPQKKTSMGKPAREPVQKDRHVEHDVERKYYSGEESKDIYGAKTMEQNVFMYCPPSKFLAVQQYVNENYEGVTLVGTSNLSRVLEEYETKLNCGHLLVFIDSEEEMVGLLRLIQTAINIKSTNVEMLHIYLIITNKSVNKSKLQNLHNSHLTNIFKIDVGLDKLSTGIIDQIMAKIIEKQPAYVRDTTVQIPKVAKKKHTLDKDLFKLKDLDDLRNDVKRIRENQGNATPYDVLSEKITYATSKKDIDDIKDMIPELAILEEYKENLDEYLEMSQGNVDVKNLNEIIISKLEVTVLQEQVLKEIFGSLISTAKSKAEEEDERVRKTNENALENFRPLAEDNDLKDMLSERAKLKDSVTEGFKKYKKEVQLVSNAVEARRFLFQDMQKSLQSVIGMEDNKVEERVMQTAMVLQQNLEKSKNEMLEDKAQIEQRLVRTLNFTNSLLRDYNVIVSLDEIIIDKLIEDNQRLAKTSVTQVYNMDNPLKAKAKTMVLLDDEDFLKLTKVMFSVDDLVITDLEFDIGKRLVEMGLPQFLEEDYTNKNVNVVRIGNTKLGRDKDNLLKKLKYLAPNFGRVIFLFNKNTDEEWISEGLENSTEVIFLTSADREELLELNEFKTMSDSKEMYGTTVIVNNWDRELAGTGVVPNLTELRVLGNFREGARELFINTKGIMTDKERVKELVLLFRGI